MLKQLREWEVKHPNVTPDILRIKSPHDEDVREIVDLVEEEDNNAAEQEVIDIETYVIDEVINHNPGAVVVKQEPDDTRPSIGRSAARSVKATTSRNETNADMSKARKKQQKRLNDSNPSSTRKKRQKSMISQQKEASSQKEDSPTVTPPTENDTVEAQGIVASIIVVAIAVLVSYSNVYSLGYRS